MAVEGRTSNARRGSGWNRVGVCAPGLLILLIILLGAASALAQGAPEPADPPITPEPESTKPRFFKLNTGGNTAARDSLRREIEAYSRAIAGLRDSLTQGDEGIELSDEQRLRVEGSIEDFTRVVESIGQELGEMELQISNNRISLLDQQGEGIVIDVPENLDEQISQGFKLLQDVILKEMPEDAREEVRSSWTWGFPGGKKPEPERTILRGNVVKIREDVLISANQDVRGNVVVVFGDAQIAGRVDGDVVAVFGNLVVDKTAEITGSVVTVAGFLDHDPEAESFNQTVIDPLPGMSNGDFSWPVRGILGLGMALGEFALILLLALIGMAMTPKPNMERVLDTLTGRPIPSLISGLLGSLGLLILGLALIGILVLTVIGIPVALLVLVGMLLLSILAIALVGVALGRRVCRLISGSCGSDWGVLLLGVLLIDAVSLLGHLVGLVPALSPVSEGLIIIGMGVKFSAFFFGIGALLLGRFGRQS